MGFKIAARTILQLGAELISSDAIAFYELIKNEFDADSSDVKISVIERIAYSKYRDLKEFLNNRNNNLTMQEAREKIKSTIDYQGSMFNHTTYYYKQVDILVFPPCKNITFQSELKWLLPRWFQKLINPNFPTFPKIHWEQITLLNFNSFYALAQKADLIGIDIETVREEIDEKLAQNPLYKGVAAYVDLS